MTKPPNIKNCTGPPCERHWTVSEWGPVSVFTLQKHGTVYMSDSNIQSVYMCVLCFYHHPCTESKASSCFKRTPCLFQLFSLQFETVLSTTVWIYGWHCVVQTNVVLNVPFKVKAWKVASLIYNYGVQPDTKMHGWEIFFAQRKVLFPMWQLTTCEHMHPLHV